MLDKDPENRSMKENSADRIAQEGEMKILLILSLSISLNLFEIVKQLCTNDSMYVLANDPARRCEG